jgi:hypothetical protein
VPVAHACNPSYRGSRDQEDHGSKPVWANSPQDPISKKPITKIGLVQWLKVKALNSSPSTTPKRNRERAGGVAQQYSVREERMEGGRKEEKEERKEGKKEGQFVARHGGTQM